MSVRLHAHGVASASIRATVLGRIVSSPTVPMDRPSRVLLLPSWRDGVDLDGYAGVLIGSALQDEALAAAGLPIVHSVAPLNHLRDGDVVALHRNGYVRTLYRIGSPHNALFTTDRCNSWCLMCSQPPRPVDDRDRINEHLRLLELIDPGTPELGITGGEPTLLKDDLLRIVERCKALLPSTALHVLSNGRLFYYGSFARKLAAIGHPDLMIGIPLYSDLDSEHDYVVQAAGAFDQTMIGLQNLARFGVPVEVRIVLHRQTYARLPDLAEFVYRNLPFASHVALMGLEMTGFTLPNFGDLWIDPYEYQRELAVATLFLAARGMKVSIYNHQLCVTPPELWPFCRQSISDWKNEYLEECASCAVQERCGGFFSSGVRRQVSRFIRPIQDIRLAGLPSDSRSPQDQDAGSR